MRKKTINKTQKVKIFQKVSRSELEREINIFALDKHIENVSYSVCVDGIVFIYCCCVLYTEF